MFKYKLVGLDRGFLMKVQDR